MGDTLKPMTTKEWLGRGRGVMREIDTLRAAKRAAMTRATSVTPEIRTKISVGSRSRGDAALVAVSEYSRELDNRIADLEAVLTEISRAIYAVDDSILRLLLIKRYIMFESFEQIAVDLHFAYRHTTRLHAIALCTVEKNRGKR